MLEEYNIEWLGVGGTWEDQTTLGTKIEQEIDMHVCNAVSNIM